jgi:hypothetical protein
MKEESNGEVGKKEALPEELYKEVQEYYRLTREYRRNKFNSNRDEKEVKRILYC